MGVHWTQSGSDKAAWSCPVHWWVASTAGLPFAKDMRICLIFIFLFVTTASCKSASKLVPTNTAIEPVDVSSPTSTVMPTLLPTLTPSPSLTQTLQSTPDFQTYDLRWCISDTEGDVGTPYIDVVKVDAIAQGETFLARIFVKSIPELLTFNREGVSLDHLEYSWEIWIDLDGNAKLDSKEYEDFADYDLGIMHFVSPEAEMKTTSLAEGTQHNIWKTNSAQQTWESTDEAKVEIDVLVGTLTITGNIPGLNPNSRIAFSTFDYNPGYEEREDKPDSLIMVPPNQSCS